MIFGQALNDTLEKRKESKKMVIWQRTKEWQNNNYENCHSEQSEESEGQALNDTYKQSEKFVLSSQELLQSFPNRHSEQSEESEGQALNNTSKSEKHHIQYKHEKV